MSKKQRQSKKAKKSSKRTEVAPKPALCESHRATGNSKMEENNAIELMLIIPQP
jgi:hypothetical protein